MGSLSMMSYPAHPSIHVSDPAVLTTMWNQDHLFIGEQPVQRLHFALTARPSIQYHGVDLVMLVSPPKWSKASTARPCEQAGGEATGLHRITGQFSNKFKADIRSLNNLDKPGSRR
jgi:hypothetical protein